MGFPLGRDYRYRAMEPLYEPKAWLVLLPVIFAALGALILYAGLEGKSVTELLGGNPSDSSGGFPFFKSIGDAIGGLGSSIGNSVGNAISGVGAAAGPGGLGNASGSVPGHPELHPGIAKVVNTVLTQFPNLTITSTTSGSHANGSYHYLGRAADIAGSGMDAAGTWIAQNLTSALTEGIHNPTLSVKNGKTVPSSFWGGATWSEHVNHIHLAV